MRFGPISVRALALLLALLVTAGTAAMAAAPVAETADGCASGCPADDGCEEGDPLCGCCDGVLAAVVPLGPVMGGSHPLPAAVAGDPATPAPSIVRRPFHPPRSA